ncbi:MAG: tRNA uridine-5-carboxymethylaminomethyl(34) synthesis enzyme MnmG [Clostridia bacterium]|nr:tRNA uridine-5-carboxymethylaminomethyl(34) synthesis enzyme MnmG [Clostridia bacterium]
MPPPSSEGGKTAALRNDETVEDGKTEGLRSQGEPVGTSIARPRDYAFCFTEADNPSVACGDSSPYTGEPYAAASYPWRVVTRLGAEYACKAVVVATGTFLAGRIFVGDVSYEGGPDGMFAATSLSASLRALGVPLRRFKTGTPCRVHRASVALGETERQSGDERPEPFSFETRSAPRNLADCYITYTNEETHRIIRENINRSALYGGQITGVGPRYCPSIEDKVTRFPDRERHQLFIEPMGLNTEELYLQGMSTSLPEEVQIGMVRSVRGLENAVFTRTAYAIEYDCVDPTALLPTLEFRALPGLYGAGQFNGTSGYEEAAAQGFVAGVNAALKLKGEQPLILTRDGSYIGTLIDDLVTCGTNEPYRMMTSRSEYRLTLRQDNADERLTPIGRRVGLISDARWADFNEKYALVADEEKRLKKTVLPPSEALNALLEGLGTTPVSTGATLAELLKRPEVGYEALAPFDSGRPELRREVWEEAVIRIRYEGYIARQNAQIAEAKRAEATLLPSDIDYDDVYGLRIEARAKLKAIRPLNVGQASRIPGVNPADVEILLIYLRKRK